MPPERLKNFIRLSPCLNIVTRADNGSLIIRFDDIGADLRLWLNNITGRDGAILAHQCQPDVCVCDTPTDTRIFTDVRTFVDDGTLDHRATFDDRVVQD